MLLEGLESTFLGVLADIDLVYYGISCPFRMNDICYRRHCLLTGISSASRK